MVIRTTPTTWRWSLFARPPLFARSPHYGGNHWTHYGGNHWIIRCKISTPWRWLSSPPTPSPHHEGDHCWPLQDHHDKAIMAWCCYCRSAINITMLCWESVKYTHGNPLRAALVLYITLSSACSSAQASYSGQSIWLHMYGCDHCMLSCKIPTPWRWSWISLRCTRLLHCKSD